MKARVVKEYIDKHTQEFHAVGDLVSLTDERFAEITRAGRYVEEVEQDEGAAKKDGKSENDPEQGRADPEPLESVEDSTDPEPINPGETVKAPKKPHRK